MSHYLVNSMYTDGCEAPWLSYSLTVNIFSALNQDPSLRKRIIDFPFGLYNCCPFKVSLTRIFVCSTRSLYPQCSHIMSVTSSAWIGPLFGIHLIVNNGDWSYVCMFTVCTWKVYVLENSWVNVCITSQATGHGRVMVVISRTAIGKDVLYLL